jgi:hypothetical protein
LAPKLSSSRSHFEDDSTPHISRSGLPIRIHHTSVLFKDFKISGFLFYTLGKIS